MGASVRLEQQALTDVRFALLGKALAPSLSQAHAHALGMGIMAQVWSYCTDRNRSAISLAEAELLVCHQQAASLLVASDLAELGEGCGGNQGRDLRIKGTTGRIEWLDKKRKAAQKGGLNKAAKRLALPDPSAKPSVGLHSCPPAPAPAPANNTMSRVLKTPDDYHPRALGAADYLRKNILAKWPTNALARKPWRPDSATRLKWAEMMETVHSKDGRSWEEVAQVIAWLFDEQDAFVVQSPKALREKWDRIEAQRSRQNKQPTFSKQGSLYTHV